MNLKVGMYIRTFDGKIGKIKYIDDILIDCDNEVYGDFLEIPVPLIDEVIKKASYNIADLIEIGDIVNGEKVLDINCELEAPFECNLLGEDEHKGIITTGQTYYPSFEDCIESVITKEQFENMAYKIKGE